MSGRCRWLWGLLWASSLVACDGGRVPDTGVERYAAAMEALQDDRPQRAEELFAAMVAEAADDPIARAGLARALARQGRYGEAIVQDKLALAADPRLPEVSYNIACSYAALGEREDALRWLSRAWDGGIRDLNLIEQDPDLDPLRQDHRFAFFLATGALSLSEREAHLRVAPAMIAPGDRVEIQLVVVSLNRPLLAEPERLTLRYEGALPDGALAPLSRVERFEAGEIGGREYVRRELTFTFEALGPVETSIGPLELRLDDHEVPVRPAWLSVREVLPGLLALRLDEEPSRVTVPAAGWFAAPSELGAEAAFPSARWRPVPAGAGGESVQELVVAAALPEVGLELPAPPRVVVDGGRCAGFADERTSALLRTRAEGGALVWVQRLHPGAGGGAVPAGCADPATVQLLLGDEVVVERQVPWP